MRQPCRSITGRLSHIRDKLHGSGSQTGTKSQSLESQPSEGSDVQPQTADGAAFDFNLVAVPHPEAEETEQHE